jgi:hypothetical protein
MMMFQFPSDDPPGPQAPWSVGIDGTIGPVPPKPDWVDRSFVPIEEDDKNATQKPRGPERPPKNRTKGYPDSTQTLSKMRFLLQEIADDTIT